MLACLGCISYYVVGVSGQMHLGRKRVGLSCYCHKTCMIVIHPPSEVASHLLFYCFLDFIRVSAISCGELKPQPPNKYNPVSNTFVWFPWTIDVLFTERNRIRFWDKRSGACACLRWNKYIVNMINHRCEIGLLWMPELYDKKLSYRRETARQLRMST